MEPPAPSISELFENFNVKTLTSYVIAIKCRLCRRLVAFAGSQRGLDAAHNTHRRLCVDRRKGDRRKGEVDRRHVLSQKFPPLE